MARKTLRLFLFCSIILAFVLSFPVLSQQFIRCLLSEIQGCEKVRKDHQQLVGKPTRSVKDIRVYVTPHVIEVIKPKGKIVYPGLFVLTNYIDEGSRDKGSHPVKAFFEDKSKWPREFEVLLANTIGDSALKNKRFVDQYRNDIKVVVDEQLLFSKSWGDLALAGTLQSFSD